LVACWLDFSPRLPGKQQGYQTPSFTN